MTLAPAFPTYDDAELVVPAPAAGPGNWAGAASAVLVDGTFWLTYRLRRPLTDGRGVAVVVARSEDGVHFEPVCEVPREAFRCESFERPALVPLPDGRWRLYLRGADEEEVRLRDAAHRRSFGSKNSDLVQIDHEALLSRHP